MVSNSKTNDRITTWIRWLARGIGSFFAIAYLYLGITTGPMSPSLEMPIQQAIASDLVGSVRSL